MLNGNIWEQTTKKTGIENELRNTEDNIQNIKKEKISSIMNNQWKLHQFIN